MPLSKTLSASKHVDILNVDDATGESIRVDAANCVHILNLLTASQVHSLTRLIADDIVEDKDGNVRTNPATNITVSGHPNYTNVQGAVDHLLQVLTQGGNVTFSLNTTADAKRLAGVTRGDKFNGLYTSGNPSAYDMVFIGYDSGFTADNNWCGIWYWDGVNWTQIFDFKENIKDLITNTYEKHKQLSPGIVTTLTYILTTNTLEISLNTPDIRNNTYTLAQQAPFEGIHVYVNGIRLIKDNGLHTEDYEVNGTGNKIKFFSVVPSGNTVQIDVLVPDENLAPASVLVHRFRDFFFDAKHPTSGKFDGTNRKFPLFSLRNNSLVTPRAQEEVVIVKNGLRLEPGHDYSVKGTGILFKVAPIATDNVWGLWYENKGGSAGGGGLSNPTAPANAHKLGYYWTPGSGLAWEDRRGQIRVVADNVERQALKDPEEITDGSLVLEKSTNALWQYVNGTWEESYPHLDNTTAIRMRLEFDPNRPVGYKIDWVDDTDAMMTVPTLADLHTIPLSDIGPGKLVYVQGVRQLYEFVSTTATINRNMTDWIAVGAGALTVVNRVNELPTAGPGTILTEGDLALVRKHTDGLTDLNTVYVYRDFGTPFAIPATGNTKFLGDTNTALPGSVVVAPIVSGQDYLMYLRIDGTIPPTSFTPGPFALAADQTFYMQYRDGTYDEVHLPAGNYATIAALQTAAVIDSQTTNFDSFGLEIASGHTYLHFRTKAYSGTGTGAYPIRVLGPYPSATATPPLPPRFGKSWIPISRDMFIKPTQATADVPDPNNRDLQITTENGHKEVKLWDSVSGRWNIVYSEDLVKQWIAAGNLFAGTIEDTGHGTAGAIDLASMPAQTALGATDKGKYYVWAGTSGYTIPATGIGGVAAAIDGQLVNPGDWVQIAEPTPGNYIYTVIPGDLLAKARGDALYGLNTWAAGAYEQGALVVHQGKIYRATRGIQVTDPTPNAPGAPWTQINLSAGVKSVQTDAQRPPTAPAGDAYLVLNSASNGGNPTFYIYDVATAGWQPVGGGTGGGGTPLDLTGGQEIWNVGVPIGCMMMWPSNTPPAGWLRCDGSTFNGTNYPKLATVLGSTTLPDMRGVFPRGAPNGVQLNKINWTTGMPRNRFQIAQAGNHHHDYWDPKNGGGRGLKGADHYGGENYMYSNQKPTWDAGNHTHNITGGDVETAPDHVLVHYIIKADESYTLTV